MKQNTLMYVFLPNMNLIPDRMLFLITNIMFKQICLYQKLEKVSPRVIYMLIKYSKIKTNCCY